MAFAKADITRLREVLDHHAHVMTEHLGEMPAAKRELIEKPYLAALAAVNGILGTDLTRPDPTPDLTDFTPSGSRNKDIGHLMEFSLAKALGAQFQFFKNSRNKIPPEGRVALLESLKEVVETLDDMGIFISQGTSKWNKTSLPGESAVLLKSLKEGDRVERRIAQKAIEGLEPSSYGLFKSIRKELEKLNRGMER